MSCLSPKVTVLFFEPFVTLCKVVFACVISMQLLL